MEFNYIENQSETIEEDIVSMQKNIELMIKETEEMLKQMDHAINEIGKEHQTSSVDDNPEPEIEKDIDNDTKREG
jgi:hypothetical protein